jgi:hypothetical protein
MSKKKRLAHIKKATRRLRRRPRRRQLNVRAGISPTTTIRTGPGTGITSVARLNRTTKKLREKALTKVKIRSVVDHQSPWAYVVYFHVAKPDISRQHNINNHKILEEFIHTSFSSQFKLVKILPLWYRKPNKVLNYVKLSDESDLFTLMLCHPANVRKIFKIINE